MTFCLAAARPAGAPAGACGSAADLGLPIRLTGKGTTRADRLRARSVLRSLTTLPRVARCGRALSAQVIVKAQCDHGSVSSGVAGLETCGSVWACPTCSAKIAAARCDDLDNACRRWLAGPDTGLMLVTLTIRHHAGQPLAELWDTVSQAWRRTVSGRAYKAAVRALGVAGTVRTTEVTYGANGWHVHLHLLLLLDRSCGADRVASSGWAILDQWGKSVAAVGGTCDALGQDFKLLEGDDPAQLAGIASYLTKGGEYTVSRKPSRARSTRGVAMEMTMGARKDTRKAGSRTPMGILADLVAGVEETGVIDADDARLWAEWEAASHGRRQQVWSRGLRDRLGLDDMATDEELAASEVEGEELVFIDAADWDRLSRFGHDAGLHEAIEQATNITQARANACAWLAMHGVPYRLTPDGASLKEPA